MTVRKKHRLPARLTACLCSVLFCLSCLTTAFASGSWLTFSEKTAPDNLGFLVQEYTGTVTITFLGDCTLGGEERTRSSARGFVRTVEANGFDYPFRNLTVLTASDDITVANLEGVLSDRDLSKYKVRKQYNFLGSASYTEILKQGSVDCVTLANNHSHDYDNAGFSDTVKALESAGIAWFGPDNVAIWKNDEGLMIGFIGVSGSVSGRRASAYRRKAELLQSLGCSAVITVMHAGTEYDPLPDGYQRQIVAQAVASGSSLVVGHHPHIAQGYALVDGVPVAYSLGNCSFGGNSGPRDHDALVLRTDLHFEEGELAGITLHFYPISITGKKSYNDYQPALLSGDDAARVLKKMEDSTGVAMEPFDDAEGSVVNVSFR